MHSSFYNRAMAQAVSPWPPIAKAKDQSQAIPYGVSGELALVQGFLRVFRFSPGSIIPTTLHAHSSITKRCTISGTETVVNNALIFSLSCTCHMPRPSYPPSFNHPNIRRGIQSTKLNIILSSAFCYFTLGHNVYRLYSSEFWFLKVLSVTDPDIYNF